MFCMVLSIGRYTDTHQPAVGPMFCMHTVLIAGVLLDVTVVIALLFGFGSLGLYHVPLTSLLPSQIKQPANEFVKTKAWWHTLRTTLYELVYGSLATHPWNAILM